MVLCVLPCKYYAKVSYFFADSDSYIAKGPYTSI